MVRRGRSQRARGPLPAGLGAEGTEAGQRQRLVVSYCFVNDIGERIEHGAGVLFGDFHPLGKLADQLRFRHGYLPAEPVLFQGLGHGRLIWRQSRRPVSLEPACCRSDRIDRSMRFVPHKRLVVEAYM